MVLNGLDVTVIIPFSRPLGDVCQHEAKATNSYQLPWTLGSTCYHQDGHQSLLIYLVAA